MAKKNDTSLFSIFKSILTGGKSDMKKILKDNPELAKDAKELAGYYKKVKRDLDKVNADFDIDKI
jgi:hypothetical protein